MRGGAGLLWGLAAAFVVWLIAGVGIAGNAGMAAAHERFSSLAAAVVAIVAPFGLIVALRTRSSRGTFSWPRAIAGGGFAGVAGGWVFGLWMARVNFFPLIAGIVGSDARGVGVALHFAIAVAIGASFGVLFQDGIRGIGSSLGWGVSYGILWWFLGPLTLLPLLTHHPIDWSAQHATTLFGSLVGHIVYGTIVGALYAIVDRVWRHVFYESDPLRREPWGPGTRTLEAVAWGAAASMLGGVAFGGVMAATGDLPRVAALAGGSSPALGFAIHMIISAVIGASFGVFFRYEVTGAADALAWGSAYGTIWWFLGPLTLFPILLGHPFVWTADAAASVLPSLVGHVVYGALTAIAFLALQRRRSAWLELDPRFARSEARRRRPSGTAAPAVWMTLLGFGIVLPLVLS